MGTIGAVIMPHNLYLHSGLVLSRKINRSSPHRVNDAIPSVSRLIPFEKERLQEVHIMQQRRNRRFFLHVRLGSLVHLEAPPVAVLVQELGGGLVGRPGAGDAWHGDGRHLVAGGRARAKLISRGPKRSQAPETEVEPPPWLEFEPEPGRRLS